MAQYVIVYIGGNQPSTSEERKQHFKKYQEWLSSLGDAVVSPMNPLRNACTVNPDGTVTNGSKITMSGYTIIETESMEAALKNSKRLSVPWYRRFS